MLGVLFLTQGYSVSAREQVLNTRMGSVISVGNIVCVGTSKGIYSINKKTGKKIKLTKKSGADMLIYRNKLYFKNGKYTYRVSVKGGTCEKLWKNRAVCFAKNGRLYYFDHGICSMKVDGSDVQNHFELPAESGDIFYYKNRIYYYYNVTSEDGEEQKSEFASLDQNFTGKKKKNTQKYILMLENAKDFGFSGSAVFTHKIYYFSDGESNYQAIQYFKGKKRAKLYQTKFKYVQPIGAADGIILVKEGNKSDKIWDFNGSGVKDGNYRVLTTSGKTIAVIK